MNNALNILMKNRHLTEYKFSQMFNTILTRYQTQKHILLKQGYKGSSEVDIIHNI